MLDSCANVFDANENKDRFTTLFNKTLLRFVQANNVKKWEKTKKYPKCFYESVKTQKPMK